MTSTSWGAGLVWVKPSSQELLIDQFTVQVRFEGVPDADVRSLQIALDGQVMLTLTAPPWQAQIDGGDSVRSRKLEAIAKLADGSTLRRSLVVSPPGFVQDIDVPLVTLALAVKDRAGKPIRDIARQEVSVLDSGKPVAISHWDPRGGQLSVAIVMDTSNSMKGERIEGARQAAEAFLKQLSAQDRALILQFNDEPSLVLPLATTNSQTLSAVDRLQPQGGTALYDAVHQAARLLGDAPADSKRVIVLLSDGRDESATGLEAGSLHTLEEAVRSAHDNDCTIFSIGLGRQLETDMDMDRRFTTAQVLQRFSESTGGTFTEVAKAGRLEEAFKSVVDELRNLYSVGYSMPPTRPGESWRSISVKVTRPGAVVRAREGYYVR
ncbi:MAG: VWA domain-containing protein [Acidobacteriota bacterium]